MALSDLVLKFPAPEEKTPTPSAPQEPPTGSSFSSFFVGQEIEYNSATKKRWVLCRISAIAADGSIEVDAKPCSWIPKEDHALKIRPAGDESRRKPVPAEALE